MKRNIISLLFCVTLLAVRAQMTFPLNDNGKYEFTLIKEIDSLSKSQIYEKTLLWVTETFKGEAIIMKDQEAGIIKLNPDVNIPAYTNGLTGKIEVGYIKMSITIYMKDNKLKFVATNFEHVNLRGQPCSGGAFELGNKMCFFKGKWDALKAYAQTDIELIATNLHKRILKKEDW